MVMNVEKISKERIQPASPTPNNLRTLKLSLLDQIAPIIAFYDADQSPNINHFERPLWLKKSLAETLTRFYPLAGTLNKDFTINCNDQGVEYSEAQVSCKLSEVVENSDVKVLLQFLPFHPHVTNIDESGAGSRGLLAVQYNIFDCGGVAISVCISHQIADGASAATFLNAWAATSRGDSEAISHPSFDAATHFPPRDNITEHHFRPSNNIKGHNSNPDNIGVTRRFVFNKSSIDALKEQATLTDVSQVKPPTRVEAVSAFIWKRLMAVARSKPIKPKVFAAFHAVNIRDRLHPPLSNCFGNILLPAFATSPIDIEKDYDSLVSDVGNAIRKINDEHLKKLLDGDHHQNLFGLKDLLELVSKGELQLCSFTSWIRFPLYDVNFGWGKPTWVTSPGMNRSFRMNFVVLMRTRDGDGIEAWVDMKEEDMVMFQSDPDRGGSRNL